MSSAATRQQVLQDALASMPDLDALRRAVLGIMGVAQHFQRTATGRAMVAAYAVGLSEEHRRATYQLDDALADAEAIYYDTLGHERMVWLRVGQHAMRWQMWAALTPGLTWPDVLEAMATVLRLRAACDWSEQEAAQVCLGLMEGWLSR